MEKGFFHPDRGYWQTTGDVPEDILNGYPVGTVEIPVKTGKDYEWDGAEWVYVPPDPAVALAAERATMVCTPLQGKLALGETQWTKVETYRNTLASWSEKIVIDSAQQWKRNSANIAFFQAICGLTDVEVDELFRIAVGIDA